MPFLKLDIGILDSTLWMDRDARDIFLTALIVAEPHQLKLPAAQLEVRSGKPTGYVVPPGWYGLVTLPGPGIIRRAAIDRDFELALDKGLDALDRLGAPEPESRTTDHDGRRLVRINGGFVALNYMLYRDKDHKAGARQARYRKRNEIIEGMDLLGSNAPSPGRDVTDADAYADAYKKKKVPFSLIVDTYNRVMLKLPKCLTVNGARQTAMRSAWLADSTRQTTEFWLAYFEECQSDNFYNGTGPYQNGHENWQPDFDFLMREKIITKIYERAMHRIRRNRVQAAT